MLELNRISEKSGQAGITNRLTKILFGLNHQMAGVTGLANTDTQGWCFWVRPSLNLAYDNLVNAPELEFLYNAGPMSMGAAIRAYLDPISSRKGGEAYTPLVDPMNPFIPMLTNLCLDWTGSPDIVADLHISEVNKFDSQFFIPKGISGVYNQWDSNSTFRNIQGDPVTALFFVWVTYINRVSEGSMHPRVMNLAEDEMDSTTRKYRIVTDQTMTKYTKTQCDVASIPTSSTIGSAYDYNANLPYVEANATVAVPFCNVGAYYESRRTIEDFNETVINFNSSMEPDINGEISGMVKLSQNELKTFNFSGYPKLENGSIDWYVTPSQYEAYLVRYGLKEGYDELDEEFGFINSNILNITDKQIETLVASQTEVSPDLRNAILTPQG